MRYMGGKSRQAKHLAEIINAYASTATAYYEPFLGGGSVFELVAPKVPRPFASDVHPDLMLMWQALLDGWQPPEAVSREEYAELKSAEPSALRGFVGFGCSFGGKWFGGYATSRGDDYCGAALRGALRKTAAMREGGARLALRSYADIDPEPGALIYCDPPYAGTTKYTGIDAFDHGGFWDRVVDWAIAGATVLISEYDAPAGPVCVWQNAAKKSLSKGTNTAPSVERLYAVGGGTFTRALSGLVAA